MPTARVLSQTYQPAKEKLITITEKIVLFDANQPPPPQWAKIMVHSTLIKQFYENGQIYEQNID